MDYANLTFGIEPDSAFLNAAEGGTLDLEYVSSCLASMNVLWPDANLGNRAGCASPNAAEDKTLDLKYVLAREQKSWINVGAC